MKRICALIVCIGGITLTGTLSKITQPTFVPLTGSLDIKTKYKSIPCSKKLFGEIDGTGETEAKNSLDSTLQENQKIEDDYQYFAINSEHAQGCLSVGGEQEHYSNNKGQGTGNLLGAVKDDKRGIVLVSTASTNNGKIEVDGSAYLMNKYEELDKGNIHAKKIREKQILNEQNRNQLLIQPGIIIDKPQGDWGFTFQETNICTDSDNCSLNKGRKIYSQRNGELEVDEELENPDAMQLNYGSGNFKGWAGRGGLFETISLNTYENVIGRFRLREDRDTPSQRS